MACLQEVPDVLDVVVAERVVAVVPAHPLAQPNGLLGDDVGELLDPLAALSGELSQAIRLDLSLGVEAQLFFHLDLDPQTLTIEAVLPALIEAAHGVIALDD